MLRWLERHSHYLENRVIKNSVDMIIKDNHIKLFGKDYKYTIDVEGLIRKKKPERDLYDEILDMIEKLRKNAKKEARTIKIYAVDENRYTHKILSKFMLEL